MPEEVEETNFDKVMKKLESIEARVAAIEKSLTEEVPEEKKEEGLF